ncbi:MAG: hypothetical protein JST51_15955 [Armatimonadetes bacterium]|nr:hypothetical protein [Armatimonadota bacterium]
MRLAWVLSWGPLGVALCPAQGVDWSGSIQQAFVSGRQKSDYRQGERFNRFQLTASSGNWTAKASYWNYSFCHWHELDNTTLGYSVGNTSAEVGRFLLPVGQVTWDNQWYSNFVFVPLIESHTYGDQKLLERTTLGAKVQTIQGNDTYEASVTSSNELVSHLFADKLNRVSLRWSRYHNGSIVGLSGFFDTDTLGSEEQMLMFDYRWTVPHWIVTTEMAAYQAPGTRMAGYVLDVNHRPKNWQDVTLAFRLERKSTMGTSPSRQETWTAAVKTRLPWDMTLLTNYTGGPGTNQVSLGGPWTVGLYKTIRF